MSGIISFGKTENTTWGVAGWAFRRLLADVKATRPEDQRFCDALAQGEIFQHLDLLEIAKEDSELAEALRTSIRAIVSATLANDVALTLNWKHGLDADGQRQYLTGIQNLVACINADAVGGTNESPS